MASNQPQPQPQPTPYPILILGAGVFGLSTALSLVQRRPLSSSNINPSPSSFSHFLSTAPIHILDSSPNLPNPFGSSIDSSRIIRADYSNPVYSHLATEAQQFWRDQRPEGWGGEGRYREDGFVVTADREEVREDGEENSGHADGEEKGHGARYVEDVLRNVRAQQGFNEGKAGVKVEELPDIEAIRRVTGYTSARAGGGIGDTGYVNWGSGWADAEACVKYALDRIKREDQGGRVRIETGMTVGRLLFEYRPHTYDPAPSAVKREVGGEGEVENDTKKPICTGILLSTGKILKSSLVILATGAWTPSLIGLRGHAQASGQVMAYLDLSDEERRRLGGRPVVMNMSRGLFVIPPKAGKMGPGHLKVARHGFGYLNPKRVRVPRLSAPPRNGDDNEEEDQDTVSIITSIPEPSLPDSSNNILPIEASTTLRTFLRDLFPENPELADRPFSKARICWYCDTYVPHDRILFQPFLFFFILPNLPSSSKRGNVKKQPANFYLPSPTTDFLISHHPHCSNLFLATGGSGHGFKFFPVIGQKIVQCIEGKLDPGLAELWRWREGEVEGEDLGIFEIRDGSRGGGKGRGMLLEEEMRRMEL